MPSMRNVTAYLLAEFDKNGPYKPETLEKIAGLMGGLISGAANAVMAPAGQSLPAGLGGFVTGYKKGIIPGMASAAVQQPLGKFLEGSKGYQDFANQATGGRASLVTSGLHGLAPYAAGSLINKVLDDEDED